MKTIKVKELKKGDELGGCTIVETPVLIGDYCGSKNQMRLKVKYSDGRESVRHWGKETTVKIYD